MLNTSRIAVILPAYNEAATIVGVIEQFAIHLPGAFICVVDNASTDDTFALAEATMRALGTNGIVLSEPSKGKASAVRRAFLELGADVYLMADADLTYPADQAGELLLPVLRGECDMSVGDRISAGRYAAQNKRPGHEFGNALITGIINRLYGVELRDTLSGYRAFNRRFVKTYPILVRGFELEADLTLHALEQRHRVLEVPISYQDRPAGSASKLRTFRDGSRVLRTIAQIMRHHRPIPFFGAASLALFGAGLLAGAGPLQQFFEFGQVYGVPMAVLAVGLILSSLLAVSTGLVLSTIVRLSQAQSQRELLSYRPEPATAIVDAAASSATSLRRGRRFRLAPRAGFSAAGVSRPGAIEQTSPTRAAFR